MARCEGAQTPSLTWADQPEDVTAREREVAELAAANLASREIATRLGITTRTVDNLLGRVYTKLGISGRQELAAVLGRDHTPGREYSATHDAGTRVRHPRGVAGEEAAGSLPPTYQRVMAWLDEGRSADEIATRLGIDPSAVPALLELTTAKYARAMDQARPTKER